MAIFTFLAWPSEVPPRVGLDHEFSRRRRGVLDDDGRRDGVPFFEGNRIEILNNGDSFYPAMLRDIAGAECSVTIEAYIYWAGEIGRKFAHALAAKSTVRRERQDSA